jgi:hypothetical protein
MNAALKHEYMHSTIPPSISIHSPLLRGDDCRVSVYDHVRTRVPAHALDFEISELSRGG